MSASSRKTKRGNGDDSRVQDIQCPDDCMERLANDLITAVQQKVRLTDPASAAQMLLYDLEVQLIDMLRLTGQERIDAIAAAQVQSQELNQKGMRDQGIQDMFIRKLAEASTVANQIQGLNLTLTQIQQFKAHISKVAENNNWDEYDRWVTDNFTSIPQAELNTMKQFLITSGLVVANATFGGYNYIKNYGLPTWYLLMTAICRLPTWCQEILRTALGQYEWILDYALAYCVFWEAQVTIITYKRITTLEQTEVNQIKDLFDRAYTGSCIMIGALLGSIQRVGLAAGEAANTAFLKGLHALPNFIVVPGNISIDGPFPDSQVSDLSQASSSGSTITCMEGGPNGEALPATFMLPPHVNIPEEFVSISADVTAIAREEGAYVQAFNDSQGSNSQGSNSQGSNLGGRRRSRRHKKRRSTLKRRRMKRRRTRKGKKRRHTKRR